MTESDVVSFIRVRRIFSNLLCAVQSYCVSKGADRTSCTMNETRMGREVEVFVGERVEDLAERQEGKYGRVGDRNWGGEIRVEAGGAAMAEPEDIPVGAVGIRVNGGGVKGILS